jgi:hypothetical protein
MRTRRLNARLRARLGKVLGTRPHPATTTYDSNAKVLAARQHVLLSLVARWIAIRLTKEWQRAARVSGPMLLPCTAELRSSALYRQLK